MGIYTTRITAIEKLSHSALPAGATLGASPRLVLKGGRIIDPKNRIDRAADIAAQDGRIVQVAEEITCGASDQVLNCSGLVVMPGLLDMHLHLGDLFDIFESPVFKAARDGVTLGLSPGAGNTFMAPALLGAEVDRGLPLNVGVYLGAAAVLGTLLTPAELIGLFKNTLIDDILSQKLTRNAITNATAHLTVGIKDHMGHFIMPDADIDALFEVTARAGLVYMSHTQDPEHAARMVRLSRGRPLHLAHANAAGCGTHAGGLEGMRSVLGLLDGEAITAEFVSSMLLENRGRRDGLKMHPKAQELAYQSLQDGSVNIIVSDGQSGATMKGFGSTGDNLPCLFTLARLGVLSLSDAIATMTCNPAHLLAKRTNNPVFETDFGHLAAGALANITAADPLSQSAAFTIVNGRLTAFDGNLVREGFGAGGLVSRFGLSRRSGVGDLALYD